MSPDEIPGLLFLGSARIFEKPIIFDNFDEAKFVHDPVTNAQKISPKYLRGVTEFVELKKLVANCADSTGMVDTELLKSLI